VVKVLDTGCATLRLWVMAIGKRKRRQESMWITTSDLPRSPGHPFYERLNAVLEEAGFDRFAEACCERFYAGDVGRPGLPPGRYFRLLLLGYFEGIDSERGIAWRASDSLAIRSFLGLGVDERAADHSTISRTRRLIDVETHDEVFGWILGQLAGAGLLKGKTLLVDGTNLEANAAMRSIVRRDTGEAYEEYLKGLAKASGIRTPTRAALARLDRRRAKKGSNEEWTSPSDSDARITKMKDGRTRLAHKAEHAVDAESGVIVALTVQDASIGDTGTIMQTLAEAEGQLVKLGSQPGLETAVEGMQEVTADKGYHSDDVLVGLEEVGLRSYISEPDRGRRRWRGEDTARQAVYANRRRTRAQRGQRLQRTRGERVERSFAHLYETGAMRRTHLRGHTNILKRLLIHAGAFNLGRLLRHRHGTGTPRGLQGRAGRFLLVMLRLYRLVRFHLRPHTPSHAFRPIHSRSAATPSAAGPERRFTTGC
jgi:transposase